MKISESSFLISAVQRSATDLGLKPIIFEVTKSKFFLNTRQRLPFVHGVTTTLYSQKNPDKLVGSDAQASIFKELKYLKLEHSSIA